MRHLAGQLSEIPGVLAVALGGSRASGAARPQSDWDFGLYYRGEIDTDGVRGLGFEGAVVEPGAWGRVINGGAWLTVEGERVDLLYRDLDAVEHWVAEAEAGRFEIEPVDGCVAGFPTYALAGELALGEVLAGELPTPEFPEALRETAPPAWRGRAARSLEAAEALAGHGDVAGCAAWLAKAAIAAAHARLAERGDWTANEKGIVRRAGLSGRVESVLAALGDRLFELRRATSAMRTTLALPRSPVPE